MRCTLAGAVKLTPAHDHNDFSLGVKHKLALTNILDDSGCLVNVPQEFEVGLKKMN